MSTAGAAWTDLGDGIRVRQSAAFQMNSVLLLDAQHTVVVDPGVLPSELDDLARVVNETGAAKVTLFFTHGHWDHVLGRPWWPRARTLAHDRFAAEVRREAASILREAEARATKHGERWERGFEPFRPDLEVSGLKFQRFDPWRLVFRDAPGHSGSQLTCHLPDHEMLIAADMLSDIEPPMLDETCDRYIETLAGLRTLGEHGAITTIIPGHGSIARGPEAVAERLHRDLEYLIALERGIRSAAERELSLADTQEWLCRMEYTGKHSETYPTESIHRDNIRYMFKRLLPTLPNSE